MKSIALINTNFNIKYNDKEDKIDTINFNSKISLLDYDIVIIGINESLYKNYCTFGEEYAGYPLIGKDKSRKFLEDITRRKKEIDSLLKSGKNIYFILGENLICYYHTYKNEWTGTGRNRKEINLVSDINLAKFFINEKIDVTYAQGKNVQILENTKFTQFFNVVKNFVYYKAFFKDEDFASCVTTPYVENLIAGYIKVQNGYKVVLPNFVNEKLYNESQSKKRLTDVDFVIQQIRVLDDNLKCDYLIPKWIDNYCLANEIQDIIEQQKLETKIKNLEIKRNKLLLKIKSNEKFKKLLYATGVELEDSVTQVFKELGFDILPSRPNRSDINLKYKNKYFVCEVKGLTKSAGEKNSNQLQKWETEFYEDFAKHPKQILIVNGYKDIPPFERKGVVFPNQMLEYAVKKEQCLLTTTQLLCLYLHCIIDKSDIAKIIKKIYDTNGVLTDYSDIENYIKLISEI